MQHDIQQIVKNVLVVHTKLSSFLYILKSTSFFVPTCLLVHFKIIIQIGMKVKYIDKNNIDFNKINVTIVQWHLSNLLTTDFASYNTCIVQTLGT